MEKKLKQPIAAFLLAIICILDVYNFLVGLFKGYGTFKGILFSLLGIAVNAALCYFLFKRKRDRFLLLALTGKVFLIFWDLIQFVISLFRSFISFHANVEIFISNLFIFVAFGLLLIFALSVCEQPWIKADFSKIKKYENLLLFGAILLRSLSLLNTLRRQFGPFLYYFFNYFSFYMLIDFIKTLLPFAFFIFFVLWLKDPYEKSAPVPKANGCSSANTENTPSVSAEPEGAYFSLITHFLLCMFTCGIWYLIWTYRTTKFLNKAPGAQYYNPTNKLLLCMFIPFYQIFWFFKHGQRIDSLSKEKNLGNSDMATLCLILGIFIPLVACIIMQDKINAICTTNGTAETAKENSTADELKKFKELLDSGIITQEEFDAKKKELLGL